MGNDLKSDSEQALSSISPRVINNSENIDSVSKGAVQSICTIVEGKKKDLNMNDHNSFISNSHKAELQCPNCDIFMQ